MTNDILSRLRAGFSTQNVGASSSHTQTYILLCILDELVKLNAALTDAPAEEETPEINPQDEPEQED